MPTVRSCADRLHQIQKDCGLTNEELKQAVKEHTRPREVKLPTFHERMSKLEKKQQKLTKRVGKKRKYKLVNWYLNEYLKPSEARKIYMEHLDFKELVNYAYQQVMNLIQLQTYIVDSSPDVSKAFPEEPEGKYDIPEIQEKEFDEYCKKHPIKSARDIIPRRKKFRKQRQKRRKMLYSKRRMRMYDPLFAATTVDAKEMYNELKRIGKENEIRVRKFHEMLGELVKDQSIGAEAMRRFDKQTEEIMRQHEKRLEQFAKQAKLQLPKVSYDFSELGI